MMNILRVAVLLVSAAAVVIGCGRSDDEAQPIRTPEQQKNATKFFDMGGPTDRNKSKGY